MKPVRIWSEPSAGPRACHSARKVGDIPLKTWQINQREWCSELETLRSETQNVQNESAAAASQTAAIMSLNLKLQSAASRTQARNIDHELKRFEANESREMLDIVQVSSLGVSSA